MIEAALPTWSSAPQPRPIPGRPGHYQLGDQIISTTFRQICESIYPDFTGLEPTPEVRQALAHFILATYSPGAEGRPPYTPPVSTFPLVRQTVQQLTQPHLWAPYTVIAAPLTLFTRNPLAAGSADALVRIRATADHALVMLETTPRDLAAAHKPAFLAYLGAHVAAAADAFRLTIGHVIMVWAAADDCRFEFISPDRCLDAWVSAADIYRWSQRRPTAPEPPIA